MDEECDDDIPSAKRTPPPPPPSQQPSKEATLNHLTHRAPVQHRPSDRSAPLHHQSPSSISYPPTYGDTCIQHHYCGFHSLWSTWGSMTSNPSNIQVSGYFPPPLQTQQQLQQRTTTTTPVSTALGYAAQELRDQPSSTHPSDYCCSDSVFDYLLLCTIVTMRHY